MLHARRRDGGWLAAIGSLPAALRTAGEAHLAAMGATVGGEQPSGPTAETDNPLTANNTMNLCPCSFPLPAGHHA